MPITHHAIDLVFRARKLIKQVSVIKVAELCDAGTARLLDLRDVQELKDAVTIPTAYHAPRGMLEFWADPQSPYHKYVFSTDRKLILFCASGMRSALATKTLKDMGMTNVIDMEGGFTEWKMQGLPVKYLNLGRRAGPAPYSRRRERPAYGVKRGVKHRSGIRVYGQVV